MNALAPFQVGGSQLLGKSHPCAAGVSEGDKTLVRILLRCHPAVVERHQDGIFASS
jgi:hypothetical protein